MRRLVGAGRLHTAVAVEDVRGGVGDSVLCIGLPSVAAAVFVAQAGGLVGALALRESSRDRHRYRPSLVVQAHLVQTDDWIC